MKMLKKHYMKIIFVIAACYVVSVFISQQKMINSYNTEIKNLETKISKEEETKDSLNEVKKNVDSTEYIEEIAREKLGMYLPNERVYIDIGK